MSENIESDQNTETANTPALPPPGLTEDDEEIILKRLQELGYLE